MKSTKKIITTLCVLVAIVLSIAVIAIAEDKPTYTGTVADFKAKVDVIETKTTVTEKREALLEAIFYLNANPVDPAGEGYADVEKVYNNATVAIADELLNDLLPDDNALENGKKLNLSLGLVNLNKVLKDDAEGYADFKVRLDEAVAHQAELLKKTKDEVESTTPFDEYNLPVVSDINFDNVKTVKEAGFGTTRMNGTDGSKTLALIEDQHMVVRYRDSSKHAYPYISIADSSKGIVFELDFSTGEKLPSCTINFASDSTESLTTKGKRVYPYYFGITSAGDIVGMVSSSEKETLAKGVIVPGGWTHLSFAFDIDTCEADVYVNYVKVGHVYTYKPESETVYKMHHLRMDGRDSKGEFAVDNFKMYQGKHIRTQDRFDSMTPEEKFIYYVNILNSDANDISKKTAYEYAMAERSKYWKEVEDKPEGEFTPEYQENAEIKDAVSRLNSFDIESVRQRIKEANTNELFKKIEELEAMERLSTNMAERNNKVNEIRSYLAKVGEEIIKDATYNEKMSIVTRYENEIKSEEVMHDFIEFMKRFERTDTVSFLEKNYEEANKLMLDSAFDQSLAENPEFSDFRHALEVYAGAGKKLEVAVKLENSKRIIFCVRDYIEPFKDPSLWEENYDHLNKYCTALRQIINNNMYDPYVEGVAEAIEVFKPVDAYFYNDLQKVHIENLKRELDKYAKTESYIEKMGIVSYVERYLKTNDIDYSNAQIKDLNSQFESYKSEVKSQEEVYKKVLEQNTVYFINLVNKLKTTTNFKDTYKVYKEAQVYYYAMNIGSEEAQVAIKAFDGYTLVIDKILDHSQKLIETADAIKKVKDNDERFALLVKYSFYLENAEDSIEGVTVAKEVLKSAYDKYTGETNKVNEELSAVGTVVIDLRVGSVASSVIKVVAGKVLG